mmetsp:Transcript_17482/g.56857  ORF Transcript_17482/g.56857 Transcript_17482/m.56857 type:complete len:269 (+) Transcript_17482:376-1182(+)
MAGRAGGAPRRRAAAGRRARGGGCARGAAAALGARGDVGASLRRPARLEPDRALRLLLQRRLPRRAAPLRQGAGQGAQAGRGVAAGHRPRQEQALPLRHRVKLAQRRRRRQTRLPSARCDGVPRRLAPVRALSPLRVDSRHHAALGSHPRRAVDTGWASRGWQAGPARARVGRRGAGAGAGADLLPAQGGHRLGRDLHAARQAAQEALPAPHRQRRRAHDHRRAQTRQRPLLLPRQRQRRHHARAGRPRPEGVRAAHRRHPRLNLRLA